LGKEDRPVAGGQFLLSQIHPGRGTAAALGGKQGTGVHRLCADRRAAAGGRANPALSEKFRGAASEVYSIGDCVQPRMIKEAIEEGFAVGMKI